MTRIPVRLPGRRNKYNVSPKEQRTVDGIVFASKKEAKRYQELKALEKAGEIWRFYWQMPYVLQVHGITIGHYIADFTYTRKGELETIVEDCKGVKTPVYRLKKKLMKAIHGIEIQEV